MLKMKLWILFTAKLIKLDLNIIYYIENSMSADMEFSWFIRLI